jgi:3-hydroxyisobutyrate dehydrogenase-like beta-hydroxyacid dehydrogenase
MGSKMVRNIRADKGCPIMVYDRDPAAVESVVADGVVSAASVSEVGAACETVISMLPNDAVVRAVSDELLASRGETPGLTHVSCSTISPMTSRALAAQFEKKDSTFIASPVFARPDGIARKEAVWMVSGEAKGRALAASYLESGGRIVDYGDDTGAANIVKLCGNFLIASSIESISEAMALAEKVGPAHHLYPCRQDRIHVLTSVESFPSSRVLTSPPLPSNFFFFVFVSSFLLVSHLQHGVDRSNVMDLLSSSIFDCLIYKGYGQRVSQRDHRAGGFSLELGLKVS